MRIASHGDGGGRRSLRCTCRTGAPPSHNACAPTPEDRIGTYPQDGDANGLMSRTELMLCHLSGDGTFKDLKAYRTAPLPLSTRRYQRGTVILAVG